MPEPVLVSWTDEEGEEHEESWPSLAAFLAWVEVEGRRCRWRAYDAEGALLAAGDSARAAR
ncbi:MAG: hypothetical protein RMM29_01010 [Planctomycetota bacterium]|nr:hypothetical protein [Planctomycetota bacterium]MCX8040409.1 hypothetical protein [Planctomycetota bacterium]MDW8372215.1 hypothetical protein [Planctomycetota bacterium]